MSQVHVKRLIKRGQLEIVLGGWVMPDEASTHYVSVIDQMVEGHQWLWENIGIRPQNSWSIDPFGYSGTLPYLWKKSGMSNMVIQRVHQAVKTSLIHEKSLEFHWRQMWDRKGTNDIFCHIMPFMLYNIKYTCGPNEFACLNLDFRSVPTDYSESKGLPVTSENIEELAQLMLRQYRDKNFFFRYNTVLIPIGDDFRYDEEVEWDQQYVNYEKLIHYLNSKPQYNIKIQWGTLKDYFKLVHEEHEKKKKENVRTQDFPILSGDFFPYSDKDMAYWTGYFTTRPFDKAFGRDVQHMIQAADALNTLNFAFYKKWNLESGSRFFSASSFLQKARRALGLFLHHDAITGTAKEFVVIDYEEYLQEAYEICHNVIRQALQSLLSVGKIDSPLVFKPETVRPSHTKLPEKQILAITEEGTTIVIFNPLMQQRKEMVRLIVDRENVEVLSGAKQLIPSQISPFWDPTQEATVFSHKFELTFLADLGPMSISPFIIYKRNDRPSTSYTSEVSVVNADNFNIPKSLRFNTKTLSSSTSEHILVDNEKIQLAFDPHTGSLLRMKDLVSGNITDLNISFQYYRSQGSGAYIFTPEGPAKPLYRTIPIIRIFQGPLVTRVEVGFEPYITHKVTLYKHPSHLASAIYIENVASIHSLKDKELIMRFDTDIKNADFSFFTDQNGFQYIRRKTNNMLRIQGNYYPVTSGAILEDRHKRLTLITQQPHGAASLKKGQLEVMLDRQLMFDDGRGLGEGVYDIKTTISRFVLLIETRKSPLSMLSEQAHMASLSLPALAHLDMLSQPLLTYYATTTSDIFYQVFSPISQPLPCDITSISLRSLATSNFVYNGTSVILHRRGYDCNLPSDSLVCSLSQEALSFSGLFGELSFSNIKETSLTHTQNLKRVKPDELLKIPPMELAAFHLLM